MKKAQMKMGETIAVLIVFFILIMVGMVIYTNMRKNSLEDKQIEDAELKSIEIATRVSQLPDIRCDDGMCVGCTDAVDILKLEALIDEGTELFYIVAVAEYDEPSLVDKYNKIYFNMFSYSTIKISMIYPDVDSSTFPDWEMIWGFHTDWAIYNNTGDAATTIPIYTPINLYNAYTEECYFGLLEVSVYDP
ncbi:hypothetical protein N9934_01090 [Desulfosarcina sp.]|nr:hypothetical protein [Desulfosarcina sp.]